MGKTKKKYKNNKGGKVLASGGFGCVFTPALKCEEASKIEPNKVSKLMTNNHAMQEYKEINNIKEKLDKIPNYEDYFLIYDITLCRPSKLQPNDLKNFTQKCSALPKNDITKLNINSKLNEVMSLNIPNGGIPIDDYIFNNGSFEKIYKLHESMTQLLKKGIIPMNKTHIYHNDIKDSNVLVNTSTGKIKTKLIDWGLSTEYIPFKNQLFPSVWRNRPFQFNVPFSVIIFSDDFVEKYTKFIKNGSDYSNADSIKPFVIDYISFWNKKRGSGHYKFINEIFYLLYSNNLFSVLESSKPKLIETEFTMPTIVNYITNILVKFTKFKSNGKLNLREYLDSVFIKNIDLWGFISCYYPFLEMLSNNYKTLNKKQTILFESLKKLFINYLHNSSDKQIDLTSLFSDLKKIKQLLEEIIYSTIPEMSVTSSIKKTKTVFTRKTTKRFKNPFFLSIK